MPIPVKRLRRCLAESWVTGNLESYVDSRHFTTVIRKSCNVYKPDGSPLLLFRKGALSSDVCERARPALRKAGAKYTDHRGYHSGIAGNFRKDGKCRRTEFTARNLRGWGQCLPFIRACDALFKEELPDRYAAQLVAAEALDERWRIGDTSFTTVTVNTWDEQHDARTPLHTDKGDLPEGFGVISVLSDGEYSGGELIFPKYRIAVDLRTTDVLLCDVHEAHGNAPIIGEPGWERIATVHYFRTDMQKC